jgi:SAM-dependent methyltransferase
VRWLVKRGLQNVLSVLPASESANYLFQRYVTGRLPIGDAGVAQKLRRARSHVAAYEEHGPGRPLEDTVAYEFGAGWDLAIPLSYAALGIGRQVLVDIRPNLRLELVNTTIASLARQREELEEELGRPLRDLGPPDIASADDLRARLGIEYVAPCDAAATGLPAASVDLVTSTNTLEHVPREAIAPVLREAARLLRPDGVMSFRIDMQDHSSYVDARRSPYDYLRYSDRAWRFLSPKLEYENRLRLPDYRVLFAEAGLAIADETVTRPRPEHLAALAQVPLAPRFRRYSPEDLAARAVEVVLRPRSPDRSQKPGDLVR